MAERPISEGLEVGVSVCAPCGASRRGAYKRVDSSSDHGGGLRHREFVSKRMLHMKIRDLCRADVCL